MAEFIWNARTPLHYALVPGPFGESAKQAGVRLSEIGGFTLFHIMARRGQWAGTAKAALRFYQVRAPARPAAVGSKAGVLVWSGPDQFLALTSGLGRQTVLEAFKDIASISDQSDGRCLIRLSGPRVRDALAKLCSLDLHETVFPVGAAAATSIDHSTVNLWRGHDGLGGNPIFNMLVFASFAESIWCSVLEASAEYGVEAVMGKYR